MATTKYLNIKFSNGDLFQVRAGAILENLAHFNQELKDSNPELYDELMAKVDDDTLMMWAGEMDWSEIQPHASKLMGDVPYSYNEEYPMADLYVVEAEIVQE